MTDLEYLRDMQKHMHTGALGTTAFISFDRLESILTNLERDAKYAMEMRAIVLNAAEFDPDNTDNADLAALGAYARAALAKNPSPARPTSDAAPPGATEGNEGEGKPSPPPSGSVGLGPDVGHLTMVRSDEDYCHRCGWKRIHHSQIDVACPLQGRNGEFSGYHATSKFVEPRTMDHQGESQ